MYAEQVYYIEMCRNENKRRNIKLIAYRFMFRFRCKLWGIGAFLCWSQYYRIYKQYNNYNNHYKSAIRSYN